MRHAWTVSGISSRFIGLCGTCEAPVIKRVNGVLPAFNSIACDTNFFLTIGYHSIVGFQGFDP